MIKKIKMIKNLAVFKDFSWDNTVLDNSGKVKDFGKLNILYGRNYSGKTTLSRIFRSIEIGAISDKYETPQFTIEATNGVSVSLNNLSAMSNQVRVFNEDFVKDNLKFIVNPDESIQSFAILGDNNTKIEQEIIQLESQLGSNDVSNETGLYNQLKEKSLIYSENDKHFEKLNTSLEKQLKDKAIDPKVGIKYNFKNFGEQNYTTAKLKDEIQLVLNPKHVSIDNVKRSELEKLIQEIALEHINEPPQVILNFEKLKVQTQLLLEKKIIETGKLEELVNNAALNYWVKTGKEIHQINGLDKCGFCGGDIKPTRWSELERHFDEESEKLEKEIDLVIDLINTDKTTVSKAFSFSKSAFYSNFHNQLDELSTEFDIQLISYISALDALRKQLEIRKNNLFQQITIVEVINHSDKISSILDKYKNICQESNKYTTGLFKVQSDAKKQLRLREVLDFISVIKYNEKIKSIDELRVEKDSALANQNAVNKQIEDIKTLIAAKKRELNDEEKGAKKVNEYITHYFGHGFLTLEAHKDPENNKSIKFEILRNGRKAYHLSEGECSLVAFCYFMAKLEDTATNGSKPIIWIDDPISSLDNNHIFFVYSIIKSKIFDSGNFEQLFISTHNLDFLKYLKRLDPKEHSKDVSYFLIERNNDSSHMKVMPNYLSKYVTEFNYLFEQILLCSEIQSLNDDNYVLLYNFANNARKFLEVYLYYKFPDADSSSKNELSKLINFFGREDKIPAFLTSRINNEYSHLSGTLERGAVPIDVPEMTKVAMLIVDQLKKDMLQFNSFLKSINRPIIESTNMV